MRKKFLMMFLALMALSITGCQHEIKDNSDSDSSLEKRISVIEEKLKNLDPEALEASSRREPSKFVTLYKSNCSLQGCGKPAPMLAGLLSEKCRAMMDTEKQKSDARFNKSANAKAFGFYEQFRCDY